MEAECGTSCEISHILLAKDINLLEKKVKIMVDNGQGWIHKQTKIQ